jgi:fibronectin-binding autotransporter adhesin
MARRRRLTGSRVGTGMGHSSHTVRRWDVCPSASVAAVGVLMASAAARGADHVSTYNTGTNVWSNSNAWIPVGVPKNGVSTYDAIFNGKYYGVSGDTLKLDLNVSLQKFTISGAYLLGADTGGPYTMTINEGLLWTGGVMGGSTFLTKAGGTIAATIACVLSSATLDNTGTLKYTSSFATAPDGQLPLRMQTNTYLYNRVGANFDIAGDAGIAANSSTAKIFNQGTWIKSTGTGVSQIAVGFSNTGSIQVQSGTLRFYGNASQFAGTATAASGATLAIDGDTLVAADATLGGNGSIQLGGQNILFAGKLLGGNGGLEVHSGKSQFTNSADIASLSLSEANGGRAMRFRAQGSASFDTGRAVSIYNLSSINSFTPGANTSLFLTGGDDIVLNGAANWTGGTFAAPLTNAVNLLSVNAGMTISGAGLGLDHRKLQNKSTFSLNGGFIQGQHGAGIDNAVDGVFQMSSDTRVDWFVAGVNALPAPIFNNAGMIIKSGGTGEAALNDARLFNTGTVRVDSGTLTLNHTGGPSSGGGIGQPDSGINSGVFEIAVGAILNASEHTMDANSTVRGQGTMQFRGNYNYVRGTYNMSGTTRVDGGLAFQSGATVVNVGQFLNLMNGGATFDTGKAVLLHDVLLGGSLGGSDPITIDGTLSGNGTLTGANVIASGNVSPGNSPGTLTVQGKLSLTSSSQLTIELARSNFDLLTAKNGLELDGNLMLRLLDGYVPKSTDTFVIANGGTGLTGQFSDVAPGERLATADGTGSFVVNYGPGSPTGANRVVLANYVTVPEPSTVVLLALVVPLALGRRRRRALGAA